MQKPAPTSPTPLGARAALVLVGCCMIWGVGLARDRLPP